MTRLRSSRAATETSRFRTSRSDLHKRALDAAIWGMPIVGVDAMRQAYFRDAGARYNDVVYLSKPADWRLRIATPNASALYVYLNFNVKDGPVVVEVPAADEAGLFGSLLDAWQAPKIDVGPDGADEGNGGRYLLISPSHAVDAQSGYTVVPFETANGYGLFRAIPRSLADRDVASAIDLIKQLRVYPLAGADREPTQRFIDIAGKVFDGIVRLDDSFYDSLARMVNEEPALARDADMLIQLRVLGIAKDEEFAPSDSFRVWLRDAAAEAHATFMSRAPNVGFPYWPTRAWRWPDAGGAETTFTFEHDGHLDVDARGLTYYLACAPPVELGKATAYLSAFVDSAGEQLAGNRHYRLRVPPPVPARQFWAATVYDLETATFIPESSRVEISSYDHTVERNDDGSVDVYFGPTPPAGKHTNWLYTGATTGRWFTMFRLYGPEAPLFDKSWMLGDVERI
jgi:Uncharacterized conserved protein